MPLGTRGAAAARAGQLATLASVARDLLLSAETRRALDGARREVEGKSPDDPWRRAVERVERAIALHERVPAELTERKTKARAIGTQIWFEARARNDFASFAPALAEIVSLTRDYAQAAAAHLLNMARVESRAPAPLRPEPAKRVEPDGRTWLRRPWLSQDNDGW